MQKIEVSGTVLLLVILSLAILQQVGFGQIPTLDNLHLSSNQSQPQCLDFNQDRVCEFIVLENGTTVTNPVNQRPIPVPNSQPIIPITTVQGSGQKLVPGGAYDFPKCLGHISDGCENILLSNGTMIKNPRNQSMTIYVQEKLDPQAYEDPNYYYYYPDSNPQLEQAQGQVIEDEYVLEDEAGPSGGGGGSSNDGDRAIKCNDPNWNGEGTCIDSSVPKCGEGVDEVCYTDDGDLKNLENQPYCDEVSDDYSGGCWDRKDYDQDTGLYPCKGNGSSPVYKQDWRECDGDGNHDGNDDKDEGCQEEDDYCDYDQNCESTSVDCVDDTYALLPYANASSKSPI